MTDTSRRALLFASAWGVVAAPFVGASAALAAATTKRDLYARDRFTSLRRKAFRLEGAGRHWRVKLTDVGNLANSRRKDPHAFSLTFRSGSTGPEQGSYLLRRPGFRATTLFLVPSDAGRRTYQAVIFRKP
jgi:hypothetical protein